MSSARSWCFATLLALMSQLTAPLSLPAQVIYNVTELPFFGFGGATQTSVGDVDARGRVVGAINGGDSFEFTPYVAFLYADGQLRSLSTLGGSGSAATGINAAGQIVGSSATRTPGETHAFLYQNGVMTDLGSPGANSQAFGINASGQVVGSGLGGHAVLFQGGSTMDLGTLGGPSSYGSAINNRGIVAGASTVTENGPMHAFRWAGGVMTDLGTPGGSNSYATAINDAGQIIGFGQPAGDRGYRAFRIAPGGTLASAVLLGFGGDFSYAYDIDSAGRVVGGASTPEIQSGHFAFLYSDATGTVDLNRLIDPASGWFLNDAMAISDTGYIAGMGSRNGEFRAFLLSPVPEPSSVLLAALAFAGVSAKVRRRGFGSARAAATATSTVHLSQPASITVAESCRS